MGKHKRKHKKAVIAGTELPFRASSDEPKATITPEPEAPVEVRSETFSDTLARLQKLKKQTGG